MKKMLMMACAAAGLMAVAEPQVSNVTVTKDARSRKVTIAYDLNEDAIVTAEILVDGTPLDVPKVWAGEVNRFVAAGIGRKIHWQGDIDWPLHAAAKLGVKVTAWTKALRSDWRSSEGQSTLPGVPRSASLYHAFTWYSPPSISPNRSSPPRNCLRSLFWRMLPSPYS